MPVAKLLLAHFFMAFIAFMAFMAFILFMAFIGASSAAFIAFMRFIGMVAKKRCDKPRIDCDLELNACYRIDIPGKMTDTCVTRFCLTMPQTKLFLFV